VWRENADKYPYKHNDPASYAALSFFPTRKALFSYILAFRKTNQKHVFSVVFGRPSAFFTFQNLARCRA
jgi:hypothetical protein